MESAGNTSGRNLKNRWLEKVHHLASQCFAKIAAFAANVPRLDVGKIKKVIGNSKQTTGLLPFELVKYFAFTALLAMLLSAVALSWMISNNARIVLLERSEAYSRLFADNLNRQVFLQFVLPTVVRYGQIALSDQAQYDRLDRIVRNITEGMRIESVSIFDTRENRIAYSTQTELKGKLNMGGLEYKKAVEGESSTVLLTGGSLLSLLPRMPDVVCTMKTFVPFRQEDRYGKRTGDIMGVIEITQDLSDDLLAIIKLQARIIVFSLSIMGILFAILSLIVVKANRTMARRAAERILLEEQLNKTQRLASLGKMVATVSHEIKNPLGIVRSTAEILEKRISKVAPGSEHLAGIIVEETSRLDSIVRGFLDFARPRDSEMKQSSLNEVAERALTFMLPEFIKKNITVDKKLDPALPEVFMDKEQIYQAVFNIVFNALQAMDDSGTLTLETKTLQEEGVMMLISDTGHGIREEQYEQIFTPFYTEKNRGTGLGLAIAKSIIDKHNGTITVESSVNQGSTFKISLPLGEG